MLLYYQRIGGSGTIRPGHFGQTGSCREIESNYCGSKTPCRTRCRRYGSGSANNMALGNCLAETQRAAGIKSNNEAFLPRPKWHPARSGERWTTQQLIGQFRSQLWKIGIEKRSAPQLKRLYNFIEKVFCSALQTTIINKLGFACKS